jgi:hypothetical protein
MFDLPSFAQWKRSRCGALTKEESDALWYHSLPKTQVLNPKQMHLYFGDLDRRFAEIFTCGNQAVLIARWQLRVSGAQH